MAYSMESSNASLAMPLIGGSAVASGVLGCWAPLSGWGSTCTKDGPYHAVSTLTLNSGNRYNNIIMVMVPGEKKLELTLTWVRNYIVYYSYSLTTCKGRGPWLQACDYRIGNGDRAVPELGYHVGQTSRYHIEWNCLIVQHQQCGEHPHQEMASYSPG